MHTLRPFVLVFLALLASCAGARPTPAGPGVASAANPKEGGVATPIDPCAELWQPLAALPDTVVPPEYPFIIPPPPNGAQLQDCARVGPPCESIGGQAQGLISRVQIVVPITDKGRSRPATEARALEIVRKLRADFGLSVVPKSWTRSADGAMRFDVDPADGFGRVQFSLETRPEMADDWHGVIELNGITGLRLGNAKPIPRETITERLLGRRYCVDIPTGEYETRKFPRVCDPIPGDTVRSCEETVRVGLTRREVRTVTAGPPTNLRSMLQLTRSANEGANKVRLVWALWTHDEPSNYESIYLVDAFTGASFTSYQMAGAGRIAAFYDQPAPAP
jgi:hypothetical protein